MWIWITHLASYLSSSHLVVLAFALCVTFAAELGASEATSNRWSIERAEKWQRDHGWLVGCNYAPGYAINQLEMWQADTFDPEAIERELVLAESLGFNSLRVFLHNLLWDQDSDGFLQRIDQFLTIADRHGIGVMLVPFDSVWDPYPISGEQRKPRPFVHNSGWVQAPGREILADPARMDELEPYVVGLMTRFKDDARVHAWDIVNEPDNPNMSAYGEVELPNKAECALQLLERTVAWSRKVGPSQPITIGVWLGDWSDPAKLTNVMRYSLDNSDVISFHSYDPPRALAEKIEDLRRYQRPILCTEFMARGNGSTFDPNLGLLKEQNVGAYNWGFVSGKSQTIYPWDSWKQQYTAEPAVWFHDIFHPDCSAYLQEEVLYIRRVTGRSGEQ